MRIIEKAFFMQFRGFHNVDISFNKPVNAIIGKKGTMLGSDKFLPPGGANGGSCSSYFK